MGQSILFCDLILGSTEDDITINDSTLHLRLDGARSY